MTRQNFWRHPENQKVNLRRFWWVAVFTVLVLAPQCGAPMPPLLETAQSPAITVAVLSPTSGELAPFGQMFRNGITMAFDAQNWQGNANDHQLEWQLYNTDCTFQTAQQVTQQAINNGAQFIIGPICSEAAIAAATVAEANGALLIAPSATHSLVTVNLDAVNNQGDTRPTVFRVAYTGALQGQAAAQFAKKNLNADTVAIVTETGDNYAAELVDIFTPQFSAAGGQIVYQNTFTPGVTNSADLLAEVVKLGAEVIYLPTSASIANQMGSELSQLNEPSLRPILLGSDAWALGELDPVSLAGSYYPTHFTTRNEQPAVQEWATAYKSKFAVEPTTLAALSFDAANILAQAIKQSNNIEPVTVAKTIANGEFNGVTGWIIFNSQHNPIKPIPFLSVGEEQTVEYVLPTP